MKATTALLIIIAGAILIVGANQYGLVTLFPKLSTTGGDEPGLNLPDQNEQNDVPPAAELQPFSNREIHTALCYLTGKDLPWLQTNAFIDSLHIEIYGKNNVNYLDMETYYNNLWTADGYTVYVRGYAYHTGYTTYSAMFTKGGDGRGVTAASGAGVTSYYGYDTMIMVGHGPLTTWIAFLTLINSS
jgi:hypothetical protein